MSDLFDTNGELQLPDDRVQRLRELEQHREEAARAYDQELLSLIVQQRYSVNAVARSLGVSPTTIRHKRDRILRQTLGRQAA
jgi:hypothetical protein